MMTKPRHTDLRTFDDWSAAGFHIVKGSRHVARDEDGEPLFSSSQVVLFNIRDEDGETDGWDDEYFFGMPGDPADFGHD